MWWENIKQIYTYVNGLEIYEMAKLGYIISNNQYILSTLVEEDLKEKRNDLINLEKGILVLENIFSLKEDMEKIKKERDKILGKAKRQVYYLNDFFSKYKEFPLFVSIVLEKDKIRPEFYNKNFVYPITQKGTNNKNLNIKWRNDILSKILKDKKDFIFITQYMENFDNQERYLKKQNFYNFSINPFILKNDFTDLLYNISFLENEDKVTINIYRTSSLFFILPANGIVQDTDYFHGVNFPLYNVFLNKILENRIKDLFYKNMKIFIIPFEDFFSLKSFADSKRINIQPSYYLTDDKVKLILKTKNNSSFHFDLRIQDILNSIKTDCIIAPFNDDDKIKLSNIDTVNKLFSLLQNVNQKIREQKNFPFNSGRIQESDDTKENDIINFYTKKIVVQGVDKKYFLKPGNNIFSEIIDIKIEKPEVIFTEKKYLLYDFFNCYPEMILHDIKNEKGLVFYKLISFENFYEKDINTFLDFYNDWYLNLFDTVDFSKNFFKVKNNNLLVEKEDRNIILTKLFQYFSLFFRGEFDSSLIELPFSLENLDKWFALYNDIENFINQLYNNLDSKILFISSNFDLYEIEKTIFHKKILLFDLKTLINFIGKNFIFYAYNILKEIDNKFYINKEEEYEKIADNIKNIEKILDKIKERIDDLSLKYSNLSPDEVANDEKILKEIELLRFVLIFIYKNLKSTFVDISIECNLSSLFKFFSSPLVVTSFDSLGGKFIKNFLKSFQNKINGIYDFLNDYSQIINYKNYENIKFAINFLLQHRKYGLFIIDKENVNKNFLNKLTDGLRNLKKLMIKVQGIEEDRLTLPIFIEDSKFLITGHFLKIFYYHSLIDYINYNIESFIDSSSSIDTIIFPKNEIQKLFFNKIKKFLNVDINNINIKEDKFQKGIKSLKKRYLGNFIFKDSIENDSFLNLSEIFNFIHAFEGLKKIRNHILDIFNNKNIFLKPYENISMIKINNGNFLSLKEILQKIFSSNPEELKMLTQSSDLLLFFSLLLKKKYGFKKIFDINELLHQLKGDENILLKKDRGIIFDNIDKMNILRKISLLPDIGIYHLEKENFINIILGYLQKTIKQYYFSFKKNSVVTEKVTKIIDEINNENFNEIDSKELLKILTKEYILEISKNIFSIYNIPIKIKNFEINFYNNKKDEIVNKNIPFKVMFDEFKKIATSNKIIQTLRDEINNLLKDKSFPKFTFDEKIEAVLDKIENVFWEALKIFFEKYLKFLEYNNNEITLFLLEEKVLLNKQYKSIYEINTETVKYVFSIPLFLNKEVYYLEIKDNNLLIDLLQYLDIEEKLPVSFKKKYKNFISNLFKIIELLILSEGIYKVIDIQAKTIAENIAVYYYNRWNHNKIYNMAIYTHEMGLGKTMMAIHNRYLYYIKYIEEFYPDLFNKIINQKMNFEDYQKIKKVYDEFKDLEKVKNEKESNIQITEKKFIELNKNSYLIIGNTKTEKTWREESKRNNYEFVDIGDTPIEEIKNKIEKGKVLLFLSTDKNKELKKKGFSIVNPVSYINKYNVKVKYLGINIGLLDFNIFFHKYEDNIDWNNYINSKKIFFLNNIFEIYNKTWQKYIKSNPSSLSEDFWVLFKNSILMESNKEINADSLIQKINFYTNYFYSMKNEIESEVELKDLYRKIWQEDIEINPEDIEKKDEFVDVCIDIIFYILEKYIYILSSKKDLIYNFAVDKIFEKGVKAVKSITNIVNESKNLLYFINILFNKGTDNIEKDLKRFLFFLKNKYSSLFKDENKKENLFKNKNTKTLLNINLSVKEKEIGKDLAINKEKIKEFFEKKYKQSDRNLMINSYIDEDKNFFSFEKDLDLLDFLKKYVKNNSTLRKMFFYWFKKEKGFFIENLFFFSFLNQFNQDNNKEMFLYIKDKLLELEVDDFFIYRKSFLRYLFLLSDYIKNKIETIEKHTVDLKLKEDSKFDFNFIQRMNNLEIEINNLNNKLEFMEEFEEKNKVLLEEIKINKTPEKNLFFFTSNSLWLDNNIEFTSKKYCPDCFTLIDTEESDSFEIEKCLNCGAVLKNCFQHYSGNDCNECNTNIISSNIFSAPVCKVCNSFIIDSDLLTYKIISNKYTLLLNLYNSEIQLYFNTFWASIKDKLDNLLNVLHSQEEIMKIEGKIEFLLKNIFEKIFIYNFSNYIDKQKEENIGIKEILDKSVKEITVLLKKNMQKSNDANQLLDILQKENEKVYKKIQKENKNYFQGKMFIITPSNKNIVSEIGINNRYYNLKQLLSFIARHVKEYHNISLIVDEAHHYFNKESSQGQLLIDILKKMANFTNITLISGTFLTGKLESLYSLYEIIAKAIGEIPLKKDIFNKIYEKKGVLYSLVDEKGKKKKEKIESFSGYPSTIASLFNRFPPIFEATHDDFGEIKLNMKVLSNEKYKIDFADPEILKLMGKELKSILAQLYNLSPKDILNSLPEMLKITSLKSLEDYKYEKNIKPIIDTALDNNEKIIVTSFFINTQNKLKELIENDYGNKARISFLNSSLPEKQKKEILNIVSNVNDKYIDQLPDIFIVSANMITESFSFPDYKKMIITEPPPNASYSDLAQLIARIKRITSKFKEVEAYILTSFLENAVLRKIFRKKNEIEKLKTIIQEQKDSKVDLNDISDIDVSELETLADFIEEVKDSIQGKTKEKDKDKDSVVDIGGEIVDTDIENNLEN